MYIDRLMTMVSSTVICITVSATLDSSESLSGVFVSRPGLRAVSWTGTASDVPNGLGWGKVVESWVL